MQSFSCGVCDRPLSFDDTACAHCGSAVGYVRTDHAVVALSDDPKRCVNLALHGCNWVPEAPGTPCAACELTRTRPSDADLAGQDGDAGSSWTKAYRSAERAKRHLVHELDVLRLPVTPRSEEAPRGLAFDLLASNDGKVTTGHASGVITIDLAEGDDVHRERTRVQLGETYRTMLGHLRHEIGHYYWQVLVDGTDEIDICRGLFGDDRESYREALDRHYKTGPPEGWEESYVSAYATMHPWEDFAETFAHYLHIRDTLDTAASFGLIVDPAIDVRRFSDVVVGTWLPLATALNQINRSMGKEDLYPFVLRSLVVDKLEFVSRLMPGSA